MADHRIVQQPCESQELEGRPPPEQLLGKWNKETNISNGLCNYHPRVGGGSFLSHPPRHHHRDVTTG